MIGKIIRDYKANASPWMVHVKSGKVAKAWAGYSIPYLKEINKSLAGAAGTPMAKVDFAGAPADVEFG